MGAAGQLADGSNANAKHRMYACSYQFLTAG